MMSKHISRKTKSIKCTKCNGCINFADERVARYLYKARGPSVLKHACLGDGRHEILCSGQKWVV